MSKVLKITKPDKTIHIAPMVNKARLAALNNRLPANQKWRIEEITEEEAKTLPYRDENYVTGAEAQVKVSELQSSLSEKDAEIERLKALLANQGGQGPVKQTAAEVIALIEVATSVDQVEALAKDDERTTVKKAAEKRIAELTA